MPKLPFLERPNALNVLCAKLAMGGDLIRLSKAIGLSYADVSIWLQATKERRDAYMVALEMRAEYIMNLINGLVEQIAQVDPKDIFDQDLVLKDLEDIPIATRRAIGTIKVKRIGGADAECEIIEIKMDSRLKAIEMLFKKYGIFIERKQFDVGPTLEAIINRSYERDNADAPAPGQDDRGVPDLS